jgi:pectate lyase
MKTTFDLLARCLAMIAAALLLAGATTAENRLTAFPGAEGFGAYTPGGRGGKVLLVTNLNDAGPGSLRAAVEAQGPRIVVFRVAGIIELKSKLTVRNPYLTVAGQSAPGDGVCLKNRPFNVGTHDVIVRYLRCRPGDQTREEMDAIWVAGCQNVILDHCSASWANDEVLSVTQDPTRDVTVQWTMITESLNRSYHHKGAHGYGSLISGSGGISFHHNIYAHHNSRNPRPGGYEGRPGPIVDFRNNVIYDWGMTCGYSGSERVRINYVGNYLKPGPSTWPRALARAFNPGGPETFLYVAGNYLVHHPTQTADNWRMIHPWEKAPPDFIRLIREARPFPFASVETDRAVQAYRKVLRGCGATLPVRDAVDARIIQDISAGAGHIIDSQTDVGGWPDYRSADPPADSDLDGMPDSWEKAHRLDPKDPSDAAKPSADGSGYTNVEEYINGIGWRSAQ